MPNRKQGAYHKQKTMKSKYNAKKVSTAYGTFDSEHEYERFLELKEMQERGEITKLELQPWFLLIPKAVDNRGKVIERAVRYRADFSYFDSNGEFVVEDAKGMKMRDYIIKRKLMLKVHGIRVREV